MIEPPPTYTISEAAALESMTERQLQRIVVDRMRKAGWVVVVTSQHKRVVKQLEGLTDLICIRWGEVVFMEVKRPGETLNPGQEKFKEALRPHLGACVHHQVVDWPDDIERWL